MARIDKSELNEDDKKLTNEQTYDSALAAMVSKLRQFIVPLVNEAFGEKFTQSTNVTLLNNKHVIRRTDDSLDRRDSDIVIELKEIIEELVKKIYTFECEAWYGKTIVIRIAEYGSSIALETAEITDEGLILNIPNSAVIFLHPNESIPRMMKITYRGPNGAEMSYDVPTLQIKDYTIDELFEKQLLILIPFYLFKFSNEFDEMEENQEKRKVINDELIKINQRLETLLEEKAIDTYQKMTIQSLLKRVSDRLVARYRNIKKEVDEIMTGAIARTQADDILEQGIEQGIEQGQSNTAALFSFLFDNGKTEDAQKASKNPKLLKELLAQFKNGKLETIQS